MFVRDRVPEVVMGPPVRPVPLLTVVTVPVPPVAEIVIFPVFVFREMPVPAVRERTPVLVTVTLPVVTFTEMPVPGLTLETAPPPPVTVMIPSGLIEIPEEESIMEG